MSKGEDEKCSTGTPSQESPNAPSDDVMSSYEELMLGVWRVLILKDQSFSMFNFQWENFSSTLPLLRRAIYDVYTISPRLFILHIVDQLWSAAESPLSLYLTNRLFFLIEKRILGGFADDQVTSDLYWAVVYRIVSSAFGTYMGWLSQQNENAYSSCIKYEFQARVFSASLASDLPTFQDFPSNVDTKSAYECLNKGTLLMKSVISFLLHLQLVIHVIGKGLNDGGPIFIAICMFPPLVRWFQSKSLWSTGFVVDAANKYYIRKSALKKFAEPELKQEIIAGGISKFLINADDTTTRHMSEYHKAKVGLGDTPDTSPEFLYSQGHEALLDIIMSLCSDGPTLYFALLSLIDPSKLSIAQLAALTQTSTSLRFTFSSIGWAMDLWPSVFSRMSNLYAVLDIKNKMKDGKTPFPPPGYESSKGMGIEVSDVSFSYPNSKSERDALSGVTFTIQPGQLVVIVGANGSGKSTIIKLLSRFYDHTSGSIRIDGIPIEEYRMDELRRGIAMLTQEHQLFPLSLEENVKLGSAKAEEMDDQEKIEQSVLAAGAEGIVKNFSSGYDTVLEPVRKGYVSYGGRGNKNLEAMQKKLQRSTSISGGEKQKLVAARTFMRLFTSSALKLVTVDEPSSALDPEAEYRLFANLRQQRNGRTMIFVTHRFGHLTKHADLVICMKGGTVVEAGTHVNLLERDGEYARLYNVQAQAFTTI